MNAPECQNTSISESTAVPQTISAPAEISKVIIYAGSADAQIYHGDNADIKIDADGRYDIRHEGTECTITLLPSEPHTFMGLFTVQNGCSADICIPYSVKNLEVHAASGDIEISNDVSCSASLGTSSGDITYFDRTGQGYQCKVRTRSGDYTLYFDNDELACGSGQNTLSCGSGTSVLEVSTSSGDIEING